MALLGRHAEGDAGVRSAGRAVLTDRPEGSRPTARILLAARRKPSGGVPTRLLQVVHINLLAAATRADLLKEGLIDGVSDEAHGTVRQDDIDPGRMRRTKQDFALITTFAILLRRIVP